jgi:hypothetical protein
MTGFNMFDKDNDGYITKSEFHSVAGPKFSFDMLDADGDDKITRAEYEAAFKVFLQEQSYENTVACCSPRMCVCACVRVCVCVCVCVCEISFSIITSGPRYEQGWKDQRV